jgi:hypothetical protein
MKTRLRRTALLLLVLLPLGGCTTGGDECDKCSSDDDCRSGFVCSTFDDGSKRCGSGVGFTQCSTVGGGRTRPVVSAPGARSASPAPR